VCVCVCVCMCVCVYVCVLVCGSFETGTHPSLDGWVTNSLDVFERWLAYFEDASVPAADARGAPIFLEIPGSRRYRDLGDTSTGVHSVYIHAVIHVHTYITAHWVPQILNRRLSSRLMRQIHSGTDF